MTLIFTEEEKKWTIFDPSKTYPYRCKENTPEEIKKSITDKIKIHKEWLSEMGGGKHE